jgi:hypothetical protein
MYHVELVLQTLLRNSGMVSTIRVVTILIRGIIDRANNFVVGAIKNREGIKKKDRTMGECGDRNLHYHR